jgi:hypothetical protein
MVHKKKGGTLRGLRIKREREEYVDFLTENFPHTSTYGFSVSPYFYYFYHF